MKIASSVLLSADVFFSLILVVTSHKCQPIKSQNGLNVFNCTGAGLSSIPEDLPAQAEVLDFSNNNFLSLPVILESPECSDDTTCPVVNSNNHCRYDVSFSKNQISYFHEHALHSLRCLRTLDLSYNDIRSSILDIRTFQEGAYKLQNLILRGNPLGRLPDNVLTEPFMRHIQTIDLSHCQLKEIGENSVDDHAELLTLDLSHNQLVEIKNSTFKGLRSLRLLDLRYNRLQWLDHDTFADLRHLDSLLLSHNNIHSFASKAFDRDSTLNTLDVSHNQLQQIPYVALRQVPRLSKLILSYNPLTTVSRQDESIALAEVKTLEIEGVATLYGLEYHALDAFPALVTLTIRRNKNLRFLHKDFLPRNTSSLREVNLEYNGLSSLSEDALPWKQLSLLRLEGNPWRCDYRISWMISAISIHTNTIVCDSPDSLHGRDIKTVNPEHLQKPYNWTYIAALILLAICLPVVAVCGFMAWKRREHFRCSCCKDIRGRYVSVYTRDSVDSDEGEDRVDIRVKIQHRILNAVSNGRADDTTPFIKLEEAPATEDEPQGEFP